MKHNYCVACGNKENLQQHHLVPKSVGGSNDETNLITLCGECHALVHGNRSKWDASALTKAALAAKKARGEQLGNLATVKIASIKGSAAIKAEADSRVTPFIREIVTDYRSKGYSMAKIADRFNDLNMATAKGGQWHASTVCNLIKRIEGLG